MSGRRLRNPRQGDRSEYLATFLLSALGLTTNVPRQEDIGFDFHCSLADQEQGLLTFGFPFLVQVKSAGDPVFEILPGKKYKPDGRRMPDHLAWLLRQELPLYLGLVDKAEMAIQLYSLAPFWFILYHSPDCAGVRFIPRVKGIPNTHIGYPVKKERVTKKPLTFIYDIDIGFPIAAFSARDTQNDARMADEKARLRHCIDFEMRNVVFFRAALPHFYWFAETDRSKGGPIPAFFYNEVEKAPQRLQLVYSFLGPALIPLAQRYQTDGDVAALAALKVLFKKVPAGIIPLQVKAALPEVFDP